MKKKPVIVGGLLAVCLFAAWALAAPVEKIKTGDAVPAVKLTDIHSSVVAIPNAQTKWVHLQFRRFAGCPMCNLHLREFVARNTELQILASRRFSIWPDVAHQKPQATV